MLALEIAPSKVPFSYKVLLPGYSDRLAYDLGLLDTDLPFEAAKPKVGTMSER